MIESNDAFLTQAAILVQVFAKLQDKLQSIGIYDFEIRDNYFVLEFELDAKIAENEQANICMEESSLSLDDVSTFQSTTQNKYRGKLEIFYDDTFSWPVPYLRIWSKVDGTLVSWEILSRLLPRIESYDETMKVHDHTEYFFGTWTLGIHPIHEYQSWTLHVCDLTRMYAMPVNKECNRMCSPLLWWMCKVLPTIGIKISPYLYLEMEKELYKES